MIRAEHKDKSIEVETHGKTKEQIVETAAVIGSIISDAVKYDKECGEDIAKAVFAEFLFRVQSFTTKSFGFDILDIDEEFQEMVKKNIIKREYEGES